MTSDDNANIRFGTLKEEKRNTRTAVCVRGRCQKKGTTELFMNTWDRFLVVLSGHPAGVQTVLPEG